MGEERQRGAERQRGVWRERGRGGGREVEVEGRRWR